MLVFAAMLLLGILLGFVGAGGAGFPTHIKLQARVDTFLVNAAECEPMLKVDQQLMVQQASRLLRGVHYAMKATGASSGIIALKEKYQQERCFQSVWQAYLMMHKRFAP